MPCSDGGFRQESYDSHELRRKNELLTLSNRCNIELTAMLCALTTETSKLDNAEDIYDAVEKNGVVNIRDFINEHKKEDEERLKKSLEQFSEHELSLIKEILNKDTRF